jgi:alpha-methylacyl-CoA racemase
MLLSDLGAEVLRIDREGGTGWPNPVMDRGRATITTDIRSSEGCALALRIIERCDILIEGFRPGVMERLGLGPEVALQRNARLIYGRVTGWGQEGPLAQAAGHDLNYIALSGALSGIGSAGAPPPPPLNLIGDFGGGSMFLMTGILAALFERERSGQGQVVDAAIVDGVTSMMAMFAGLLPSRRISMDRDRNLLGGAAPFYRCYACADGKYVAVGALEPKFYSALLEGLGLSPDLLERQFDQSAWDDVVLRIASVFLRQTRDEWCAFFETRDACVAPVLELAEAPNHSHMAARKAYDVRAGVAHAAPAPRFSRTPGRIADAVNGVARIRAWGIEQGRHR